jgi:HxlR-like helix-turn-helix
MELTRLTPNTTRRMLTLQLRELEAGGIVVRHVYPQVPPKVEYELTPFGETLAPALISLREWGEAYKAPGERCCAGGGSGSLHRKQGSTYPPMGGTGAGPSEWRSLPSWALRAVGEASRHCPEPPLWLARGSRRGSVIQNLTLISKQSARAFDKLTRRSVKEGASGVARFHGVGCVCEDRWRADLGRGLGARGT